MGAKRPFFSVVMPVYKAQRFLRGAARSVLRQTFEDFELILVDDASPDESGAVADALAEQDERVKAVHLLKNGGLSRARNAGMRIARGRYVFFMDADDAVDKTLLQCAYASLSAYPARAVLFGMREEYYGKDGKLTAVHEVKCRAARLRGEELRREIINLERASLFGYACNKVYDLDFIREKGLLFETVTLIEDVRFNAAFFTEADSLNCLSTAPYHYKKRGGESLTSKFAPDYYELHMERVRLMKALYETWGMYDAPVKRELGAVYARFALSALRRNCDRRAHMSRAMRKSFVKELTESELYRELMPHAQPRGRAAKASLSILASGNEAAMLLLGRAVYLAEKRLPFLFAKAKQSR